MKDCAYCDIINIAIYLKLVQVVTMKIYNGDMKMDVTKIKVRHAIWGTGTIVEQAGMYITVDFPTKTSKFIYPDAFENFINAEDLSIQSAIIQEIYDAKLAVEVKKQAQANCKAENQKAVELASVRPNMSEAIPNPASRFQRLEGKRMTFFVFQGNTFEREYQGNFIWAPISNKSGNTFHHWTRLLDVRTGDIILHGCDGYIKVLAQHAVSAMNASSLMDFLMRTYGREMDEGSTAIIY